MFKLFLCWFVFFAKYEGVQFILSKEYSRVTSTLSLNSIIDNDDNPLIPLHLNSEDENNGLVPFYVITNETVTLVNDFRMGSEHRRRHRKKSIYSGWSDWSLCSKKCTTIRKRHCIRPKICGSKIVTEFSRCFTQDSDCLRLVTDNDDSHLGRLKWSFPNKDNQYVPMNFTCGMNDVDHVNTAFKSPRYLIKIMGGQESDKFHWPWQVAVLNELKKLICGGTLVAPGWVLTAAHCSRQKLYARLREHDLSIDEGDESDIMVERVILHPGYNPNTVDNDMALLSLRTLDVETYDSYYLQPACLPVSDFQLRNRKPTMCVVLGWGKVPIVGQRICRAAYRKYLITDNMFCAGYRDGRSDTCSGDSGGPLLCQMRGRWTVVGVTSFGDGCGRRGKYGIYASVANKVPWITSTITKSGFHQRSYSTLIGLGRD